VPATKFHFKIYIVTWCFVLYVEFLSEPVIPRNDKKQIPVLDSITRQHFSICIN